MKTKGIVLFSTAIVLFAASSLSQAEAKKFTITDRQVKLSHEIDASQKSGELTLKEATSLRDEAADIDTKIQKMKSDNGGKLSYKNEHDLEKSLNKLSLKIHKKQLQKRIEH